MLMSATAGLLVAYTAAMFILYTVAPMLYRMASSAYYNISLLTSDFYGLLFGAPSLLSQSRLSFLTRTRPGLFLFHYSPFWLYFVAFAVVLVGLVVYFWHSARESPSPRGLVGCCD